MTVLVKTSHVHTKIEAYNYNQECPCTMSPMANLNWSAILEGTLLILQIHGQASGASEVHQL